jgi:serine/threonine-protein kinase
METVAQLNSALAGRYAIERELGAGGMATVFLARDLRHDRRVALKVLRPELGAVLGPERFEAEIKVTANLHHPNLLPLFDSGEARGDPARSEASLLFYVMPYVDGESLRVRLDREKQLPIDEAVSIAVAVAGALDYAHAQGVIHRDLKPENILIHAGQAVVADFGIALAVSKAGGARITQTGISLGTPQYMSPEQATGDRAIDGRTDIYSLAAVLYEMLAGEPPHSGGTAQAIIARLMTERPRPVRAVRANVAEYVEAAIARGLEKVPADRFATGREFAECLQGRGTAIAVGPWLAKRTRTGAWRTLAVALPSAAAAGLVTWLLVKGAADPPRVTRATIRLPAGAPASVSGAWTAINIALSPLGTHIVYAGAAPAAVPLLYLRALDRSDIAAIPGTDGALNPFFSPDGAWVGFFAGGKLKKVRIDGGAPETICDAAFGFGAAWSEDGTIVFGGSLTGGLSRVSAQGGEPVQFTTPAKGELVHRWPTFLPGGREILFAVASDVTNWLGARIAVQALDAKEHRIVLDGGTAPHYLAGQLVFARSGSLYRVSMDRGTWAVAGSPVPVLQGLVTNAIGGQAEYGLSTNGSLVYLPGDEEQRQRSFVWVDRRGKAQPVPAPPRGFERPRVSPDGRVVALTIREADADVWVMSLERGTLTRLTSEVGEDESPVWTNDGKRVTYSSTRAVGRRTLSRSFDGSGSEEELFAPAAHQHLVGWMPDGVTLVTDENEPGDLVRRRVGERSASQVYLHTPFYKRAARLSPDGRWIAYVSDESGRNEVYVQGDSGRKRISTTGGTEPAWARSGRELFFRDGEKMMAVDVQTTPTFHAGAPHLLFEGAYARLPWGEANYDVSPDAQKFLMIQGEARAPITDIQLVLNWAADLGRARDRP